MARPCIARTDETDRSGPGRLVPVQQFSGSTRHTSVLPTVRARRGIRRNARGSLRATYEGATSDTGAL